MIEGSIVIVLGTLDKRIRERQEEGLVFGTLYQISGDQVIVILDNMDLWVGLRREIRLGDEQK